MSPNNRNGNIFFSYISHRLTPTTHKVRAKETKGAPPRLKLSLAACISELVEGLGQYFLFHFSTALYIGTKALFIGFTFIV